MRPSVLLLLLLPSVMSLYGQTTAATPPATSSVAPVVLNMEARLVSLPVVVRDRKGALVQTLSKDDFVLNVDGAPQVIRYFDHDADLSLTLGLLVDASMSQREVLEQERTASVAFLDSMLQGKEDKAFVIQFARTTELLADLTSSHAALRAGLKDIDVNAAGADSDSQSASTSDPDDRSRKGRGGFHSGGTVLYDATFLASDELMQKQKGRKALILLTDGDDRGSRESVSKAIEAAQRADTTIYAIYYKGRQGQDNRGGSSFPSPGGGGFPGGRGGGSGRGQGGGNGGPGAGGNQSSVDGKKILERMTGETGGRVFEVKGKQDTASIYKEIGDELRAQYRLGYTPDAAHIEAGYHQVELSLHDPHSKYQVQTREGYYSGKP